LKQQAVGGNRDPTAGENQRHRPEDDDAPPIVTCLRNSGRRLLRA
jgi:hypothetical protein